ncbi:MAG TPA: L-fucokinase [Phycisphaerales bacterium]|nr:L-fucokinase [Phycisphaerales bacterium]
MHTIYDWLVVTAANTAQGRAYRAQLAARETRGTLRGFGTVLVVPDPHDRRAGSGGSTFIALAEIIRRRWEALPRRERAKIKSVAEILAGQRILIIHSGGDSRRLPAYAAQGKVFAPLPCDTPRGHQADLFDLVLEDTSAITPASGGGVLIAAGDVLLGLREARGPIQRAIAAGSPGVVGVAFRAPASTGSRHGVYVLNDDGQVRVFAQKPSEREQRSIGAHDSKGRALVDTGVVHIDHETMACWLERLGLTLTTRGPMLEGLLAEIASPQGSPPAIDLYHHVLGALPIEAQESTYVGGFNAAADQRVILADLFHSIRGPRFFAAVMDSCEFLHIGTTREMIRIAGSDARVQRRGVRPGGRAIYNSPAVANAGKRGDRVVIEACDVRTVVLEGDNLVVGLPAGLEGPIHIPRGWGLAAIPVGASRWACICFGDGDDCKSSLEHGGTFGNRPLSHLLSRGCDEQTLWPLGPGAERSLWTAELWTVGPMHKVIADARWLMDPEAFAPAAWRSSARRSLAQLVREVNHDRLIAHRTSLQRRDRLARLAERVQRGHSIPAADIASDCTSDAERASAARVVARLARTDDHFARARLKRLEAELTGGRAARAAMRQAFEAVGRGVHTDVKLPSAPPRAAIRPDEVVWVTTPVRIDLAGGWSDTPPVCNELGGTVVNMAITLNGQFPVQVIARRTEDRTIRLSSVDLGRSVTIRTAREAMAYDDPSDWAALPKAAMVLSGVTPSRASSGLDAWLKRFGGGLDLTVFSALPKGSGLGTSSVLGAAILACLDRVVGRAIEHASIIRRTSVLEQMMSTAGGWQDQVGGITPGVKINRTRAGEDQTPHTTPIAMSEAMSRELAERSVLYYTGQRRLARDILQKVVSRYLARDREALGVLHALKDLAERTASCIAAGDVDEFAMCIAANWEYKKRLDPGSTNPKIEAILKPLAPRLSGYEMPGAGGGGFLYMIARSATDARRVRAMLSAKPPNALARCFEFAIDGRGLGVSVL